MLKICIKMICSKQSNFKGFDTRADTNIHMKSCTKSQYLQVYLVTRSQNSSYIYQNKTLKRLVSAFFTLTRIFSLSRIVVLSLPRIISNVHTYTSVSLTSALSFSLIHSHAHVRFLSPSRHFVPVLVSSVNCHLCHCATNTYIVTLDQLRV